MVKNITGGNKSKKVARKNATAADVSGTVGMARVRTADECNHEMYAVATKMLGGGRFECFCSDHNRRNCYIPGLFSSGKGRKSGVVRPGTWIVVGIPEFTIGVGSVSVTTTATSSKKAKLQQCQLLEVYSDAEKSVLISSNPHLSATWTLLRMNDTSSTETRGSAATAAAEDSFDFCTEEEIARQELMAKVTAAVTVPVTASSSSSGEPHRSIVMDDGITINVDDI